MTINHDRIELCQDREVPKWIRKAQDKLPPDTTADANHVLFSVDGRSGYLYKLLRPGSSLNL